MRKIWRIAVIDLDIVKPKINYAGNFKILILKYFLLFRSAMLSSIHASDRWPYSYFVIFIGRTFWSKDLLVERHFY